MTVASNAFSKAFSRPKGIPSFAVLAVLGVLVANSVTCFAAFNVAEYVKHGRSLGERANREQAKKELAESLDFEIELAKISLPSEKRRDMSKLYNPTSVKELESKYPGIPWAEYANELLSPHAKVRGSEEVIVVVPSFLEAFAGLMNKTPKRVLANYAMWRVAGESAGLMGERVQKAQSEFEASLTGTSVKEPRWKECVGYAANSLYIATGALYVRRHFDESAKANAMEIIQNIRKSFERILEQLNWMDEKTRKAALEKLDWIQPHIAYPDEFLDDKKLDGYYQWPRRRSACWRTTRCGGSPATRPD